MLKCRFKICKALAGKSRCYALHFAETNYHACPPAYTTRAAGDFFVANQSLQLLIKCHQA